MSGFYLGIYIGGGGQGDMWKCVKCHILSTCMSIKLSVVVWRAHRGERRDVSAVGEEEEGNIPWVGSPHPRQNPACAYNVCSSAMELQPPLCAYQC